MMDLTPERLPQRANTKEIIVDYEQVDLVLDPLMEAYRENRYPYYLDRVRTPQDERHMPPSLERGTKEHAMFFWNVCYYMRGGTKSTFAVQQVSKLYEDRPDLFDCAQILETTEEDIVAELSAHKLGFQYTVAKAWRENAQRMLESYDGDPRNVFAGLQEADDPYSELVSRVKNDNKGGGFMGFREKMTSMIAYYLMDQDLVDVFNFPIPVDLHVMRVSVETKMVQFPGIEYPANVYSEKLLKTLRDVYADYAERKGISPLELCNAVWLLSEALCGQAPGNRVVEPNGRENRDGRLTKVVPEVVDQHDPSQQDRYRRTCGRCPIEKSCDLNIHGGAMYYAVGQLAVRGPRLRFETDQPLFGEDFFYETY